MTLKILPAWPLGCVLFLLTGCTLLPVKKIQPLIAPPDAPACTADTQVHLFSEKKANSFGYVDKNDGAQQFGYLLPANDDYKTGRRVESVSPLQNFTAFDKAAADRVNDKLDQELASDPVVKAFTKVLVAVSAEAQLDSQIADGTTQKALVDGRKVDVQGEFEAIRKQQAAPKLSHVQLKSFANKVYEIQLKHTAADYTSQGPNQAVVAAATQGKSALTQTSSTKRPKFDQALVGYLKAYYGGKFYDRMGTAVSKPQLPDTSNLLTSLSNFSVPDSEITAAEMVMLEFLIDTLDPTPVLGNTKCPIPTTTADPSCKPADGDPTTTTYYPGSSSNQPTALAVGLANYIELPTQGCGFTTKNVWVLQSLANGASDEAGTISGLVANTAGGLGVSLGVFGKISIGDNATLSDLVKTAASDLALRTTLLASYFSLYHVNFTPFEAPTLPGLVASPTSLMFSYSVGGTLRVGSQNVSVANSTKPVIDWNVTSDQSWLTFTASQPLDQDGTVIVSVDPTGLKPQTYSGTLVLTPQNSTASKVSIPVTFTISPQ